MYQAQDTEARKLGAVSYFDEFIVRRSSYGPVSAWLFARYYFNADRTELGYFIPDLLPFHEVNHLNVHPTPRQWAIVPQLRPIEGS